MASNLQKVRTDKYGELEVVQSFHEGPQIVHLLKNGAYVFGSGLPVKEEKDLRTALGRTSGFIEDALEWLKHKDDRIDGSIREIKHLHGKMVYADDGSPVNSIEDIIAFFEPGPFREAAFAVYAQMVVAVKEAQLSPPGLPRAKKPVSKQASTVKAKTPAGKKAAAKGAPKPGVEMGAAEGVGA